jgi:hypothetical protein
MPDSTPAQAVTVCEYPRLICVWPLILAGFLFWPFARPREVPDVQAASVTVQKIEAEDVGQVITGKPMVRVVGRHTALGWTYLGIVFLVLLAVGIGSPRNDPLIWLPVLAVVLGAGWALREVEGFTLFGNLYRFFAGLNVGYDRGMALALSILLLVPYLGMVGWTWLNHRWRISRDTVTRATWGRLAEAQRSGPVRARVSYRDLPALVLCGAGTLTLETAGGHVQHIQNVPLLPLKKRKIDQVLEGRPAPSDPQPPTESHAP